MARGLEVYAVHIANRLVDFDIYFEWSGELFLVEKVEPRNISGYNRAAMWSTMQESLDFLVKELLLAVQRQD